MKMNTLNIYKSKLIKENLNSKFPGLPYPEKDISFLYSAKDADFSKALRTINAAIFLNPNLEHYCFRAQIKQDSDDLEGAIEDYNTCIDIYPNDGNLYKHRAILKMALEDYSNAYEDMIKAGARLADGVTPEVITELRKLSESQM